MCGECLEQAVGECGCRRQMEGMVRELRVTSEDAGVLSEAREVNVGYEDAG